MSNLRNNVRLMGHLGQNPEIRTTPSGKKVATFSLATNEVHLDANGQKVNETMWHNLIAWGKLADLAEKYLEKGKEICVEGKISNRNYIDKNGQKKYLTEIVLSEILLMGHRSKKNAGSE
jgi:single-strand DNA-binding protein